MFAIDFARALAGTGIRQVLFGILAVVESNPGIKQGEVGHLLGIQRANMVALINELVEAGLVDRRVSADDRRALSLTLSAAGTSMLGQCLDRIRVHEGEMLAGLNAAERAQLMSLLIRIQTRDRPINR